ncbi:MAG: hypothetical protein AAF500_13220 [Myxococcota bacterium]
MWKRIAPLSLIACTLCAHIGCKAVQEAAVEMKESVEARQKEAQDAQAKVEAMRAESAKLLEELETGEPSRDAAPGEAPNDNAEADSVPQDDTDGP